MTRGILPPDGTVLTISQWCEVLGITEEHSRKVSARAAERRFVGRSEASQRCERR